MNGYSPASDEWSFKRHNENTIVIQNGKNWTLLTQDNGPIYEQFLYRFCEQQMDSDDSAKQADSALFDALVKIRFRCDCYVEDGREMSVSSVEMIKLICDEAIAKATTIQ